MSPRSAGAEQVRETIDGAEEMEPETPRPLMRDVPPADPFPVDALGDVLRLAAEAIHDRVRAPLAMCGQSVLAVATLAVQGHADVVAPTGQARPLSSYFITIGVSGERKTAVDTEALWPVRKREAALREAYDVEYPDFLNAQAAWEKARDRTTNDKKANRATIKVALDLIGPAPDAPLLPTLTCTEPTFEGLTKLLGKGWPSVELFNDEGGQFIGGHGMTEEAKLRTSTGLSKLWDGRPVERLRGGDGLILLPGRRLAMHLMLQPMIAARLYADGLLIGQGLLSRVLPTFPESAIGVRLWREPSVESEPALKRYGARLLDILEMPLPVAEGKRDQLSPRKLLLSAGARRVLIGFHDHIEPRLGAGGELEPVCAFANKLPEHATRIAGVRALVNNITAIEVTETDMQAGVDLAQHYLDEAMRIHGASQVSEGITLAQHLLHWLLAWPEQAISLPTIYQRGPNSIRDNSTAKRLVGVLEQHGWLVRIPEGAIVAGQRRREAWRIVRG
jgi:hypothetical protein